MLDICSAPGGKAFTAAQYMKNRGKLYAFDLFDHKLKLIQNGARRLGISVILTSKRDGATGVPLPLADKILCDVPCSGLGILSRKPEIRTRLTFYLKSCPSFSIKSCAAAPNIWL